jgi:glycosyltransferase involved in cell wall biosynthesis
MVELLDREQPEALGMVGYVRPESMAALRWARKLRRPTILMSESQAIDHRRVWWKEAVKRRRVQRFSAALVGGPRHRDYLVTLGMPADRVALGYDAVDHDWFAQWAESVRSDPDGHRDLPEAPYFLAVSRFVREKNLPRLVRAFARFRRVHAAGVGWHLVLCGDGPGAGEVEAAVESSGVSHAIHRPGFLQAEELVRWYAGASAFVHPSLMEPWGLVVNEAAACGLPLLVSDRAGCIDTLVPEPPGTTGRRFDPRDETALADGLGWLASLPEADRTAMGRRAADVAAAWGPARFAQGTVEALEFAVETERSRKAARDRIVALAGGEH